MTKTELAKVSENDKNAIAEIIDLETYPRTVKEIRGKLRHTGRVIPEYLITRTLRSLLSEGKLRFKGGRWMSNELSDQMKEVQTGFTPRGIQRPRLSYTGEKSLQTVNRYFTRLSGAAENFSEDQGTHVQKGPWDTFRSTLSYYTECLRNEEGADASAFIEDIGRKYLFANGIGNWHPRTGESWSYVIPMGPHVADFVQNLFDNIVVLGYPIEAVRIKQSNGPDTRLIRPVFQYIFDIKDIKFTDNSINISTSDARPEISLEWMKYSLKSYSEQYHFLSHCGLINQRRPNDEPMGFTSEDIRPDLDELAKRLSSFMPKKVVEPLNSRSVNVHTLPTDFKNGIYNKAVIMIGNRTKYTQTLLKELNVIKSQSDENLNKTALKYLFTKTVSAEEKLNERPHEETVADALPMNAEQRESVASVLTKNLSVVTGPPGTGKTQVVMGSVANARIQNKSILFTSRNHKAIDAVVDRLKDQNGSPLIVRANSKADPNIKYTFKQAINDLQSDTLDQDAVKRYERNLKKLKQRMNKRGEHASALDKIWALRDKIGDLEEKIAWLKKELQQPILSKLDDNYSNFDNNDILKFNNLVEILSNYINNETSVSSVKYLFEWITILPLWFSTINILNKLSLESELPSLLPPLQLEKVETIDIKLLRNIKNYLDWNQKLTPLEDELKDLQPPGDIIEDIKWLSEDINTRTSDLIMLYTQSHGGLLPDGEDRESLASLKVALGQLNRGFEDQKQRDEVEKRLLEYVPILLENFPCWAVTNLSVGSRIPLAPGIFDVAIIDEASQSDIASAIPILFRSKRAAVVGDPHQLKHVSRLTVGKDSLLMKRAGLIEFDDKRYSYRETSLYGLFAGKNSISPHLLRETYRSTLEIAEYSNHVFYNGMLRVATNEKGLMTPAGTSPGVHWTEVSGPVVSAGNSGCVSENEVDTIYELVKTILVENNFKGTLGVVTPFRQQQKRLHDRIFDGDIPFEPLNRSKVIADTAHGFQGDEKDVMIFSLCAGQDMPGGSLHFIRDNSYLFNVAVSRARAVLHVVGNKDWALKCGIKHIVQLAQPPSKRTFDVEAGTWAPHESPWEKALYEALLKKGIEALPQYPASGRRLDLALVNNETGLKIDIEVDSDRYHRNPDGSRKKDDTWRDIQLMGMGWKVMRFWVYSLKDNIEKCVSEIEKAWRKHE